MGKYYNGTANRKLVKHYAVQFREPFISAEVVRLIKKYQPKRTPTTQEVGMALRALTDHFERVGLMPDRSTVIWKVKEGVVNEEC